ncbi:hypothetical protein [Micromonospora aurantiaca (nom. illeg.)]|uniref:hypothetical protein n=1 Tax=Micromonospora aurantiaca (nom. illeg.) TaxID=47850 RepID=UPI0035B2E691
MTTSIRQGSSRSRWLRLAGLPIGLCLAVAVGACDGGKPAGDSPSATSASAPEPGQGLRGSVDEAALAAYRGMWQAYAKAGLAANPDEPELARHATGQALSTLKTGLAKLRKDGEVIKGEYESDPHVVPASPSTEPVTVSVQDCLDTTRFLTYKAATGALADDVPGGKRAVRATVVRDGDGWKVSSFGVQAVGTC